jgi:hypothetical protein
MTLIGVALVPDQRLLAQVVEFAKNCEFTFDGMCLDEHKVLPHVSLHQLITENDAGVIESIRRLSPLELFSAIFDEVILQPPDWIFLTLNPEPWLLQLQTLVVQSLAPLVNPSDFKRRQDLVGYTPLEAESYVRHGYRYVGEAFKPHFTLGRVSEMGTVAAECTNNFNKILKQRTVTFARLIVFRAGPGGTVAEVLYSTT